MKNSEKPQSAPSSGEERIRRFAEIETLINGREVHVREARLLTALSPGRPTEPAPSAP